MDVKRHRLIVVSNRLPFVFHRDKNGSWRVESGAGGLVSALLPVLRHRGGTWIGWPGMPDASDELDPILDKTSADAGYALQPVHLTAEEVHDFYHGFSNEVIWPLFHDLQSLGNFEPKYWRTYREYDVFWWMDSFLSAAFTKDLSDFPLSANYVANSVENYWAPD